MGSFAHRPRCTTPKRGMRVVWGLLFTLLVLGAAPASASEKYVVRVRIFSRVDRVVLIRDSGKRYEVERVEKGLSLNGGRRLTNWRTKRSGPYKVQARGSEVRVRGRILIMYSQNGLTVINEVPLEDYVAGTLGAEMYSSWDAAALRAQAVACRSYAVHRMAEHDDDDAYDVVSSVRSQVYRGIAGETVAARAATKKTRGEVLQFEGRPILAAFHSASGGRTASSAEVWGESLPYLRSVPVDAEDDSPDTYWRATISGRTLAAVVASLGNPIGEVTSAKVVERSPSGRVVWLQLRGKDASIRIRGGELRKAVGRSVLKSTVFEVRETPDGFAFVGSGSGHGVGMSQWGAQAMASSGSEYREILTHFYPGTGLRRLKE